MRLVSVGTLAITIAAGCGDLVATSGDVTDSTDPSAIGADDATTTAAAELRSRRPRGTGGAAATGGQTSTGGNRGTGGATATGGAVASTGGTVAGTGGAVATGGAAPAPGQVIFSGDFETGDLSQWAYVERCQTDRISVYSTTNAPAGAPAPRQGKFAARLHVMDGDVSPCTSTENPRAEMETPESLFKPGDDRWEAWSLFIPAAHPQPICPSCVDQNWFAIQEDYGAPWDGSPSIGWFLDFSGGAVRIRMDRGEQYGHDQHLLSSLAAGRWVDFLVHKKFANTASGGGFVEAWVDKVPMTFAVCNNCTKLSTQTMHSTQKQVGFYLTSYRARGTFSSFDTYYDAVRIGTTRASVEML